VYGHIEKVNVITDPLTNNCKGFGFVTFVDRASAESALNEPNPIICGQKARVNFAAKPHRNLVQGNPILITHS
jgi:RNA recognition motif-containing protein